MKRLLIGLTTGGAVLALTLIATNAFFSDVETSSGNTFTAGKLDLQIDSEQHYNGNVCSNTGSPEAPVYQWVGQNPFPVPNTPCTGTWPSKSLDNEKFFDFTDVKPGDWGENTVSFEVKDNPAWMCASLDTNSFDATSSEVTSVVGQLQNYLKVFWWVDDGDNIYEGGATPEKILYNGVQSLATYMAIADPLPLTFADKIWNWETDSANNPIPGNTPKYLGVGWCFGDIAITGTGNPGFTCSGVGGQNDAQGDKVVADLVFTVEQSRNNPDFYCPEHYNLR